MSCFLSTFCQDLFSAQYFSRLVEQKVFLSSGGKDSNNNLLNSVEVLQTDGTFTSGPSLPEPIAQHCIEGVDDNRVFMSGGDVVGTNVGNKKAYMYSFVSQVMYATKGGSSSIIINQSSSLTRA